MPQVLFGMKQGINKQITNDDYTDEKAKDRL